MKCLEFGAGWYRIDQINGLDEPLVVRGKGPGVTTLEYAGPGPAIRCRRTVGGYQQKYPQIEGVHIIGGGIELESTLMASLRDVWVEAYPAEYGLNMFGDCLHTTLSNCHFESAKTGIRIDGCKQTTMFQVMANQNSERQALVTAAQTLMWWGGLIQGNGLGARFESCEVLGLHGIHVEMTDGIACIDAYACSQLELAGIRAVSATAPRQLVKLRACIEPSIRQNRYGVLETDLAVDAEGCVAVVCDLDNYRNEPHRFEGCTFGRRAP